MSCGVGCRGGSDPKLLWLWHRLVTTALTGPLAWEPPYAMGAAQEMANKQTNKQKKNKTDIALSSGALKSLEVTYLAHPRHCSILCPSPCQCRRGRPISRDLVAEAEITSLPPLNGDTLQGVGLQEALLAPWYPDIPKVSDCFITWTEEADANGKCPP